MVLALLAKLDLIKPDEAKALAKKLNDSISPYRYEEAERVIAEVFDSVKPA